MAMAKGVKDPVLHRLRRRLARPAGQELDDAAHLVVVSAAGAAHQQVNPGAQPNPPGQGAVKIVRRQFGHVATSGDDSLVRSGVELGRMTRLTYTRYRQSANVVENGVADIGTRTAWP